MSRSRVVFWLAGDILSQMSFFTMVAPRMFVEGYPVMYLNLVYHWNATAPKGVELAQSMRLVDSDVATSEMESEMGDMFRAWYIAWPLGSPSRAHHFCLLATTRSVSGSFEKV